MTTADHFSLLTFTLGARVLPVLHQRHPYKENQALVNGLETISVGFNPLLLLESTRGKNIFERSCTFSESYD